MSNTMLSEATELTEQLQADRRWLHGHPETGFALTQTKEYVNKRLTEMGFSPEECGKCGLVVTIRGSKPGKTFLLRADMDALPIREESDVPFASSNGNMHACGHDMHTAMLLGAAALLRRHREELCGTVKLMFQSAEEIFQGAQDMITNGILEGVDAAMMIHVIAGMPIEAGTVIVSAPGVSAPAADYFTIQVQGRGCHGSAPQNGVDALTAAAHILVALQELHARELAASDEAVLTIGTMQAGTAANAIADSAEMRGTIRTYDEKTRSHLKTRLPEISRGIAAAFRAEASVAFGSGCPTLTNSKELSEAIYRYVSQLLGEDRTISAAEMTTSGKPARGGGSEDFAYVSQKVPSLMLALAAGEPDNGYSFPQHHPKVKFDESVLPVGAAVFAASALRFLRDK